MRRVLSKPRSLLTLALFGSVLLGTLAAGVPVFDGAEDARPVDVFASLDGRWRGTFAGYDTSGKELYRIAVEQRYWTVDENTQKVEIRDTAPDGTVTTGEGENIARIGESGELELRCIVRKSNGERAEHRGRIVKGPDGDKQLVWFSKSKSKTETFRESVRHEGEQVVYSIDGLGIYGGEPMLMSGRYYRQPAEPPAAGPR